MTTRSLHARLQEYCDCYVESDLKAELERFVGGSRQPCDEDETEAALKVLALILLGGVERRTHRICVSEKLISLSGGENGLAATFSPEITTRLSQILGEIAGIGNGKDRGRISLGLRGDEILLTIERVLTDEKDELIVGIPSLRAS
ncbi:MAG: hypothetical protein AB1696_03880 [Planctomycetota bacterium]